MRIFKFFVILLLPVVLIFSGCAHYQKIQQMEKSTVFLGESKKESIVQRQAPLFLTHNFTATYNRIGRPSAKYDNNGQEQIYIEADNPVIYYLKRDFSTKNGNYTNLIYRVHFSKIPYSLVPFHLAAGQNVGVMIVITINSAKKPVLITTVHTCGCYRAIVPTSYLRNEALPLKWKEEPLRVYGETLPGRLDYAGIENPKLLVYLRPGVHRVMDLEVIDDKELQEGRSLAIVPTPLKPIQDLEYIPLNGETTSLYHKKGVLKGYVKGSIKIWESVFLSLLSMDFFIGTDKVYGDAKETGNHFYTSLKPWNRSASDMWNFGQFLEFWGWRL